MSRTVGTDGESVSGARPQDLTRVPLLQRQPVPLSEPNRDVPDPGLRAGRKCGSRGPRDRDQEVDHMKNKTKAALLVATTLAGLAGAMPSAGAQDPASALTRSS